MQQIKNIKIHSNYRTNNNTDIKDILFKENIDTRIYNLNYITNNVYINKDLYDNINEHDILLMINLNIYLN